MALTLYGKSSFEISLAWARTVAGNVTALLSQVDPLGRGTSNLLVPDAPHICCNLSDEYLPQGLLVSPYTVHYAQRAHSNRTARICRGFPKLRNAHPRTESGRLGRPELRRARPVWGVVVMRGIAGLHRPAAGAKEKRDRFPWFRRSSKILHTKRASAERAGIDTR